MHRRRTDVNSRGAGKRLCKIPPGRGRSSTLQGMHYPGNGQADKTACRTAQITADPLPRIGHMALYSVSQKNRVESGSLQCKV